MRCGSTTPSSAARGACPHARGGAGVGSVQQHGALADQALDAGAAPILQPAREEQIQPCPRLFGGHRKAALGRIREIEPLRDVVHGGPE